MFLVPGPFLGWVPPHRATRGPFAAMGNTHVPEDVVERLVLAALRGTLPPLSSPPALPAQKGGSPRLLALDLLAWIALGRGHYGRPGAPHGAAEAFAAIRTATAAGTLVVPERGGAHLPGARGVCFWGSLMGACFLASVPIAILYNLFVDRFIAGFTVGAVKG
jgi:hypothetical protein